MAEILRQSLFEGSQRPADFDLITTTVMTEPFEIDWTPYDRVADIWNRLTLDWGQLSTFWDITTAALPFIKAEIDSASAAAAQDLVHGNSQRFLVADHGLDVGTIANGVATANAATYQHVAGGALLVFAHALLDDVLLECLRLSADMDVAIWMDEVIGKKTASFSSLRQSSVDEVARATIQKELDTTWARASLIDKVDTLHRVVRPSRQIYLEDGFRFDRERLSQLAEVRNRIVHCPDYRWQADPTPELAFMRSSGTHLLVMTVVQYDLAISSDRVKESLRRRIERREV